MSIDIVEAVVTANKCYQAATPMRTPAVAPCVGRYEAQCQRLLI